MPEPVSANSKVISRDDSVSTTINRVNLSVTDQKVNLHGTSILSTNVGWQILELGLKREKDYQVKLITSTNKASSIQQTMQKLIELNGLLSTSEKDVVLSDQALAICKDLEENAKITLLKSGEKKVSPARMGELKVQIGAHNDRLKTELQTIFSTEIQVLINEINSLTGKFTNNS